MQMYSQTINLTHEFKSCVQMTKHFAMVKNQCQCRKANPLVLGHCIFKTGTKLQTATARDFYLEGEVSEKKIWIFFHGFPFHRWSQFLRFGRFMTRQILCCRELRVRSEKAVDSKPTSSIVSKPTSSIVSKPTSSIDSKPTCFIVSSVSVVHY